METKKWYKSKGIWAGVLAIVVAIYNAIGAAALEQCGIEGSICFNLPAIPEWAFMILGALGVWGRTSASSKIG